MQDGHHTANAEILLPSAFTNPEVDMCDQEALVNRHRGCGHNILLYYSGETYDCWNPRCVHSSKHIHQGQNLRNCGCSTKWGDHIKVVNLIQEACDGCKEAAVASLNLRH